MSQLAEEESEWIFEYVMNLFRSPAWEVHIMTFIDENCAVFDDEDENKFAYTEVFDRFREVVDSTLAMNLSEIGISTEDFAEVCEHCRYASDISEDVVSQILAIDDFSTFKKLMVKRNMELELEAIQSLQEEHAMKKMEDKDQDFDANKDDDEEEEEEEEDDDDEQEESFEDESNEVAEAMEAIFEMEIRQRQEEVEQAELEAAIAMSIAIEEERLRLFALEAKQGRGEPSAAAKGGSKNKAESKSSSYSISDMEDEIAERKLKVEETFRNNKKALKEERRKTEELRAKTEVSEEEMAQRAKHLREQRDRLLAKKKKERDAKLRNYEQEQKEPSSLEPPASLQDRFKEPTNPGDGKEKSTSDADERRHALRVALARRMKQDLLGSEAPHDMKRQLQRLDELDEKMQKVEKVRQDNRIKQEAAYQDIAQQQNKRIRDAKPSTAHRGQGIEEDECN